MASDDGISRWLRRRRRRLLLGLTVGLSVAVAVVALRSTPPMRVAEAQTYDMRTRWVADPAAADTSVVILAIDENSLEVYSDMLGRWPWPRDVYGGLLQYLAAGGARLAVFDIMFREPDLAAPLGDTLFAEALAAYDLGILAFTLTPGDSAAAAEWEANSLENAIQWFGPERGRAMLNARRAILSTAALEEAPARGEDASLDQVREYAFAEPPVPMLAGRARALGVVTWSPDPDGVSRSERLVFRHRGRLYPSLPLAAARELEPDRFAGPVRVEEDGIIVGSERIPLDDGRLPIRWRGPYLEDGRQTYRIIPAHHVLQSLNALQTGREPEVPLETFAGKTVLVASTAVAAFDVRATPVASHDPGVMIHATILDNLLRGDYLTRAPWLANAGLAALTALAAALVAATGTAAVGTLGAVLVLLLAGGLSTLALSRGVWLDMAAPFVAGALAFAGTMVANYLTEGRDKRRVKDLFGRYVAPEYVRRLADDFENVRLGGERVPVTLLFSDIRGFTSLSEQLPAETVIGMLNEYLEKMAEVVFRHGGTLDKFIGDAVMAFWGAPVAVPDHADRAAKAALDMLEEVDRLNEQWAAAGVPGRFRIGIGLNTGEAIVGNIGSLTRKLDYTAIGDTVNLASRLEGLNKQHGTSIIVGETTRAALPDGAYDLKPMDSVHVKGKENVVHIYELAGRKPSSRPVLAGPVLGLLLLLALPSLAGAQSAEKARWTDWVYRPGAWSGGQVDELVTRNEATDSLALVGKVDLYAMAPRWRAELRPVLPGDSMGEAVVMVFDGDAGVVLTPLGSTPLAEHTAAEDPMVQALLATVRQGQPRPPGPARVPRIGDDDVVQFVILRKPAARADFAESLFETGSVSRAGRSLLRLGVHAIGGERDQEVVASAGARGVATVKTVDGEITVMPDTAGILGIQRVKIGILTLDRFLREAGIHAPTERPKQEEGA